MKTKEKTGDWIIAHDGTKGADAYMTECLRCGNMQRFTLPISVDVYVAAATEFVRIHSKCKENQDADRE